MHAKSTTGLSQEQLDLLCDRVADQVGTWQPPRGRHRTLDLATAVTMTLVWLRHNLSQALLGAFHGISQPTVSRIIGRLRELIARAANQGMPGVAETEPGERLLLDGSLLATGNRTGQQGQGLYSGKRHKAGMNVQVISADFHATGSAQGSGELVAQGLLVGQRPSTKNARSAL